MAEQDNNISSTNSCINLFCAEEIPMGFGINGDVTITERDREFQNFAAVYEYEEMCYWGFKYWTTDSNATYCIDCMRDLIANDVIEVHDVIVSNPTDHDLDIFEVNMKIQADNNYCTTCKKSLFFICLKNEECRLCK